MSADLDPGRFDEIHPTLAQIRADHAPSWIAGTLLGTADRASAPPFWIACTEPERPHDEWAVYADECPRCRLKLAVEARRQPETRLFYCPVAGSGEEAGWQAMADLDARPRP